jgi:nucleoside 2-deoxyribosyltransferase
MEKIDCFICNNQCSYELKCDGVYSFSCDDCGLYRIQLEDYHNLKQLTDDISPRQIANIRFFLEDNKNFTISRDNIETLLSIPTPSIIDRCNHLLLKLSEENSQIGQDIIFSDETSWLISAAWAIDYTEFLTILQYLNTKEYIQSFTLDQNIRAGELTITIKGWAKIEELRNSNLDSAQGFVAMWFDNAMEEIYNSTISRAISDAGYTPHIVKQGEHINKIDDEIIVQIRRSKFVVADFTGNRQNVYYEAGYAQGSGIRVIMTCREDDANDIRFDIRQYNYISWTPDKLEDFKKNLSNRIEAVLGRGPIVPQA